jgi:hypothetical protein
MSRLGNCCRKAGLRTARVSSLTFCLAGPVGMIEAMSIEAVYTTESAASGGGRDGGLGLTGDMSATCRASNNASPTNW